MATKTHLESVTGMNPGSLVHALATLEVGQTYAKAERIECDAATKETLTGTLTRLRNAVASCVKRAADTTGQAYVVEGGDIRTRSFDFLLVIAITRTA